jgi:hypothetical protein
VTTKALPTVLKTCRRDGLSHPESLKSFERRRYKGRARRLLQLRRWKKLSLDNQLGARSNACGMAVIPSDVNGLAGKETVRT